MKRLKNEIATLKEEKNLLQVKVDAAEAVRKADVAAATSSAKLDMAKELEQAHEKGYKKCEENFKDMQKMMKDWEKKE